MHPETPELQFALLFKFLETGPGIVTAFLLVAAIVPVVAFKSSKWWMLALLLFFSPLMVSLSPYMHTPSITPLRQFRHFGRPICATLLILLLIPALQAQRGWRFRLVTGSAIAYFIFELILSTRLTIGDAPVRGIFGGIIFGLTFIVLGIGLPKWLQDFESARSLLRCIAVAGLLFAAGTVLQLAVNPNAIILQDRLFCLTGNPQEAALVLSMTLIPVAFLVSWKDESKMLRILWAFLAALLVLLLLWTGSRTGALVAAVGLVVLFRRHLGRMCAFSLICGALILIGLQMWFDVSDPASRLLSTADDRTAVWSLMYHQFLSNPLIGVTQEQANGSENSYLLVASRVGIVGLIPLIIALGMMLRDMLRLYRMRDYLREQSMLVDLVLAGMAAVPVGACFEGFLMGTITHQVFLIYIYLAISTFLVDVATTSASQAEIGRQPALSYHDPDELPVLQNVWSETWHG